MSRLDEWKEVYSMTVGTSKFVGSMVEMVRVPGGVVYKIMEDRSHSNTVYHQTGSTTNMEDEVSVSITFAPFPPGLYEKLSQL